MLANSVIISTCLPSQTAPFLSVIGPVGSGKVRNIHIIIIL